MLLNKMGGKNMKKKIFLAVIFLIGIAGISGCVDKKEKEDKSESVSTEQTSKKEDTISATIKILDGSQNESKEISTSKDKNLLEIMKKNFDIKVDNRKIVSIDGIEQDEKDQLYWIVTVNGEELNVDLDQIYLNQGDTVEFHLEK